MSVRLLQVFLSESAVSDAMNIFEVSTNDKKELSCNCPGFVSRESCKHVELVNERIEDNNGMYPFDFIEKVSTDQIKDAMENEFTFRNFIINKTRIEVF